MFSHFKQGRTMRFARVEHKNHLGYTSDGKVPNYPVGWLRTSINPEQTLKVDFFLHNLLSKYCVLCLILNWILWDICVFVDEARTSVNEESENSYQQQKDGDWSVFFLFFVLKLYIEVQRYTCKILVFCYA